MSSPTSPRPARVWLPVPAKQVVYTLSTDHYPWSDICADLEMRPQSAVLEARLGPRRGYLLWSGKEVLGACDQHSDLSPEEFMKSFGRSMVRLSLTDPDVLRLIWQCRDLGPQALTHPWPEAQNELASGAFNGVLLGGERGEAVSFWKGGRPLGGTLPNEGRVFTLGRAKQLSAPALAEFWSEVLSHTAAHDRSVTAAWRSCAAELVGAHPCLDPFVREVWLEGTRIHVNPALSPTELRAAMLAVFRATFHQIKLRISLLPMAKLQASPMWNASGAGELT